MTGWPAANPLGSLVGGAVERTELGAAVGNPAQHWLTQSARHTRPFGPLSCNLPELKPTSLQTRLLQVSRLPPQFPCGKGPGLGFGFNSRLSDLLS